MAPSTNLSTPDLRAEAMVEAAAERLDSIKEDLELDFSEVRRLDPAALRAMHQLVLRAEEHRVKVKLRGVNVEVYKVLKLSGVAGQFSFVG